MQARRLVLVSSRSAVGGGGTGTAASVEHDVHIGTEGRSVLSIATRCVSVGCDNCDEADCCV